MNGIRRLEELTISNPEIVSADVHVVTMALIVEVVKKSKVADDTFFLKLVQFSDKEFTVASFTGCHSVRGQIVSLFC